VAAGTAKKEQEAFAMRHRHSWLAGIVAVLIGATGLFLLLGGAWLARLGGSWYYVLAGVALLVDAWLLWRARAAALALFALVLAATLLWALWESGLDWWPLAARLDVLFVLGVLLLPLTHRHVDGPVRPGRAFLGLALLACLVLAIASWFHDPHDREGTLAAQGPGGAAPAGVAQADWTAYGGSGLAQRYSALTQLTPQNVSGLREAWHYRTGDLRGRAGDPQETTYEVTPLKIGNRLFLCTPHQLVIALDATTGQEVWRYDPKVPTDHLALQHLTCRGLSWQAPAAASAPTPAASAATEAAPAASAPVPAAQVATAPVNLPAVPPPAGPADPSCNGKLFMATADGRLLALNPDDGHLCGGFGQGGQVNLWIGMPNYQPGGYYSTSPPVVTSKLVIVGGTVLDNWSTHEQSGVIRAYDVNTGQLVWNWDSGNPAQTAPLASPATYTANAPNSWSISAVDEGLGMVYVPMGNQPPDQWGVGRPAATERVSSSIVALDLATGAVRWVFQTVHHDLWDYDVPSQPSLLDLRVNGATVPALVQPTKQGELFVLDRRTGTPLLPVSEQPAPDGAQPPDRTAPTQPRSAISFDPQPLSGAQMWGATLFDQLACRIDFHRLRYQGRFTPPSLQGTIVYPGNFGVFNWGSIAVDPVHGWAFTTPTYLPFISQLLPRPNATALVANKQPPQGSLPALNENFGAPYAIRLAPLLSPLNIPCNQPPWGYVAGIDLATGRVTWQHRNGTVRDLAPVPVPFRMGVPNLGGPIITAGGVAFLSGTMDYYVRAYDLATGKELWRSRLPAGGQATPMTYQGTDGRQYLLVVAGGHGSTGTKPGDDVIAYALPH
jgi:quinoprotein glucose dehydrogenase